MLALIVRLAIMARVAGTHARKFYDSCEDSTLGLRLGLPAERPGWARLEPRRRPAGNVARSPNIPGGYGIGFQGAMGWLLTAFEAGSRAGAWLG